MAVADQTMSTLFTLPRELRDQVYQFTFSPPSNIELTLQPLMPRVNNVDDRPDFNFASDPLSMTELSHTLSTTGRRRSGRDMDTSATAPEKAGKPKVSYVCEIPLLLTCKAIRAEAHPHFLKACPDLFESARFILRLTQPMNYDFRLRLPILDKLRYIELRLDLFDGAQHGSTKENRSAMFSNFYDLLRSVATCFRRKAMPECNITLVYDARTKEEFGPAWESFTERTVLRLLDVTPIQLSETVEEVSDLLSLPGASELDHSRFTTNEVEKLRGQYPVYPEHALQEGFKMSFLFVGLVNMGMEFGMRSSKGWCMNLSWPRQGPNNV